jgi:MFS family permease
MNNQRAPARLIGLVTLAVFINYIDRGNLSTAAPLIQHELQLSATQLGALLGAFYYSYVLCMPATGWLAERFGAPMVLAAGVAVWSAATALTGLAGGFASLMALRLMLGVGESVAFPCASKLLAQAVSVEKLGLANGILGFGYLLGPAIGTLLGGLLMARYGWRPVFMLFGLLSALWLWPWLRMRVGAAPRGTEGRSRQGPAMALILKQRALWGAAVGHFASNYTYYFILSWLPFYLIRARGFTLSSMAVVASWAYLLNAVGALAMGALQDRWIRAGASASLVYKGVMAASHVFAVACMIGMVALPERASVAALFVFGITSGASYPGLFAIPQIIAGPEATGRWVGLQNAAGNVAGLIAPLITGVIVDRTGGFGMAFALAAAVNIVGLAAWVFILPRVQPLDWASAYTGRG